MKFQQTSAEFLELVRISEEDNALHGKLMDLGSRVASAYVEFLESINFELKSVQVDWGSPHPDRGGSALISTEAAQRAVSAIRSFEEQATNNVEVNGLLIGVNSRTMKFEIEQGESNIAGDIDESAKEIVNGAVIGGSYRFSIREVQIFKPMIAESSLKYYLTGLEKL